MKNDFNITTSTGAPSTLVATEITTGVIAGCKTRTTPIYATDILDGTNTIRSLMDRISALEHIRSRQLFKVENCPNCGATMQLDAEDHILKCRYCRSVVFVGIKNVNG